MSLRSRVWGVRRFRICCLRSIRECLPLSRRNPEIFSSSRLVPLNDGAEDSLSNMLMRTQTRPRNRRRSRQRPYAPLYRLHVHLVYHNLRPYRMLDLESRWMDLQDGWIGFRWWNACSYLFWRGCFGIQHYVGKEIWIQRHTRPSIPTTQCHARCAGHGLFVGGLVRV